MAVKLSGTIRRFIGLSTDAKPFVGQTIEGLNSDHGVIEANDLPPGSSFLETDTGRIWRYDGQDWKVFIAEDAQQQVLEMIYAELHTIRETIQLL